MEVAHTRDNDKQGASPASRNSRMFYVRLIRGCRNSGNRFLDTRSGQVPAVARKQRAW